MKISKKKLQKIIKEELEMASMGSEMGYSGPKQGNVGANSLGYQRKTVILLKSRQKALISRTNLDNVLDFKQTRRK